VARVAVSLPIRGHLDFAVPEAFVSTVEVGRPVTVPVQGRPVRGIVVALVPEHPHPGPLEPVLSVHDGPRFSPESLAFALRVANDDLSPAGLFVNRLLPRGARAASAPPRTIVLAVPLSEALDALEALTRRAPRQAEIFRLVLGLSGPCPVSELTRRVGRSVRGPLSRLVEKGLVREVLTGPHRPALATPELRGKSERTDHGTVVLFAQARWDRYLDEATSALREGRTVVVLAPEILAAEQLHAHLASAVPGGAALYHSGVSEGERGRVWESARRGETRLVVGTRSALFLPMAGESFVIVDEEQDRSYKQDEMVPHYHARDAALHRGCEVLLGSAAPSIEVFYRTRTGGFTLDRPAEDRDAPAVRTIDLAADPGPLSAPLTEAIERTLHAGRRVLLGVNRRGHFQATLCKRCGYPLSCPHCGLNLTYDVRSAQLVCRTCGRAQRRLACPRCGSRALRFVGSGAGRLAGDLEARFPGTRVARVDASSLRTASGVDAVTSLTREAPLLVATSILAKGPPLPGLGLVAAVDTDVLLARPDFRAAERTYQFLRGLFGRLESGGEAIVQTHHPDHPAIRAAATGDYDRFYEGEIVEREALSYPPFCELARLSVRRAGVTRVLEALNPFSVDVLGPTTQKGTSRLLLKAGSRSLLRQAAHAAQEAAPRLEIDFDPQ